MKRGHITPCWSMNDVRAALFSAPEKLYNGFKLIDYQEEVYKNIDISINIHKTLPEFIDKEILENEFNWLREKMYAIHRMTPNTGLPSHADRYEYYSKTNNIDDINQIERIIVFLEDKKPGHEFVLESYKFENWKSGDWVSWSGSTVHAAYNNGSEDRYTMQITGIKKN
jgi:hypothetical protein